MKLEIKDIEEQKEKKFHPFKIEMLIESEDDLLDLWARFNFHTYAVNSMLSEGEKKSIPEHFENVAKWKFIDDLLNNKPYMK